VSRIRRQHTREIFKGDGDTIPPLPEAGCLLAGEIMSSHILNAIGTIDNRLVLLLVLILFAIMSIVYIIWLEKKIKYLEDKLDDSLKEIEEMR
jgi:hypothetical protein